MLPRARRLISYETAEALCRADACIHRDLVKAKVYADSCEIAKSRRGALSSPEPYHFRSTGRAFFLVMCFVTVQMLTDRNSILGSPSAVEACSILVL